MGNKILVTGGAGFLGSHLCKRLIDEGNEVICLDNLYTGSKKNISKLLDNENFEFIRHDIVEPIRLEVDEIYNLACPASPIHYQNNPVATIKTCVIGSINMLGLAKRIGAKILQASTSEVYGDPLEHPQTEEYFGNVNTLGPRANYDEGKRCAETLFSEYNRQHGVNTKIMRIFNSLTGDQNIVYFKNGVLKFGTFEDSYDDIYNNIESITVPCFDSNSKFVLRGISGVHKHKVTKRGYKLKLTWGKSVKLTEDHGVFTRDENGDPKEVFVKDVKVGDCIAVPNYLPVKEIELKPFNIEDVIQGNCTYSYIVNDNSLVYHKGLIKSYHDKNGRTDGFPSYYKKIISNSVISKGLKKYFDINNIEMDFDLYCSRKINNKINNIDDFLWFLGFYLAEGCLVNKDGDHQLIFCSNVKYLEKLIGICEDLFGLKLNIYWDKFKNIPSVILRSKIIMDIVVNHFGFGDRLAKEKDIPNWVLQLPKNQLIHFLYGFWQGDGNHDAKTTGSKLILNSSSKKMIDKFNFILSRFGIIGSTSEFYTRVRKEDSREYKAYRITVQGLDTYDILKFNNVSQCLQRKYTNDIQWASVVSSDEFNLVDEDVYDFSVPDLENFIGGDLVCCHNTYGPNMHPEDGRVVSNFIMQALNGEDITIYGDGSQTRSFCYVDDLIDGMIRIMNHDTGCIAFNIGNPNEITIKQLAEEIIDLTKSKSKIIYKDLPKDDPARRKPDISRATSVLKWEPLVDRKDGLKKTIKYFKKQC
jgi:UDP-glucuronate decarboxylase